DKCSVKPYLAAAPFGALDQHHVPMHGRTVPVVANLVGQPRREVQRTGDLLIEQNVAHRIENVRIETKRELADVTRARIGIEDFIQLFRIAGSRFDDFASLELQMDILELGSRINRGGVESD